MNCLIGDIGGTNCRLATWNSQTNAIEHRVAYPTAQFKDLTAAVSHFKAEFGIRDFDNGCVAIANPINGDLISMTNASWSFSIKETQQKLKLKNFTLINDWESIAYGLHTLPPDSLKTLIRQENTSKIEENPCLLAGVGTGLGAALLIPDQHGRSISIAGEAGHMTYAPTTDIDIEIFQHLRSQFGHVSFERLLSGPGLENIRNALESITQTTSQADSAAEIVAAAQNKTDRISVQTLNIFTRTLGCFVGNLMLALNANGGIYLGGGVLQKIGSSFCCDTLHEGLTNKGRLTSALSKVPVYLITDETAALRGCVNRLKDMSVLNPN